MTEPVAVILLFVWWATYVALSLFLPFPLSDKNSFLKAFVSQDFLSFMGVVVTITLASASNLFIELNKLEDKVDMVVFTRTKRNLKHSAFALIGALLTSVAIVVGKPLLPQTENWQAAANGTALLIVFFSVFILIDLTNAAFSLDPRAH